MDSRVIPLTTFTPPGSFGAVTPGVVGLTYDAIAAQASLDAFLTAEAMTLTDFNNLGIILAYNTSEQHEAIANAVAQMWLDTLGVSVILDSMEWSTYLDRLWPWTPLADAPHIFRLAWCDDYPDANNWLSSMFKADEDFNFVRRACNDDNCTSITPTLFDEKLDQAAVELDLAARETLYYEAEQILAEDEIAYAPLLQYGDNIVARPYLTRTYGSNESDIANWSTAKVRTAMDGDGGGLVSYDGTVAITVPAGAFDDLVILSQAPATGMPPGASQIMIGDAFYMEAEYGTSGTPASPSMPFTVTVNYSTGDLGGVDETILGLYYWDGGQWVLEASSLVDPIANTVTAWPEHFSRWAIMVEGGQVNGSVFLQSRTDHSGAEVCGWDGGEQIACTTTLSDGSYELTLPGGTYIITAEMERYLDGLYEDVTLFDGQAVEVVAVQLLGGDSNDSDTVNILDLSLMGARFGMGCGDSGWDDRADINDDCMVNILDLAVAGGNYQVSSPVPWEALWEIRTVPGIPDGARSVNLWSDAPDNLYVWFEVVHEDPITRTADLYHWDGSTWSVELSYPGYTRGRIFGTGPDDIFVSVSCPYAYCTGYETPHLAHFDGATWEEQTLPPEVGNFIHAIGGAPGEVQAATIGSTSSDQIIIRYNYSTEQWSHLYTTPEGFKAFYILSADEAYYVTCWGHGRWNGSSWSFKHEFDFCDVTNVWGMRDGTDELHLYTIGNNNHSNGVRIWKYTENPNPALLGTFGSKYGYVFSDGSSGRGTGVWGSAGDNVYAGGYLGPGADPDSGRVYHYDGSSWQQVTEMGDLPLIYKVWGTGPYDVWFTLADGRLLHYGY